MGVGGVVRDEVGRWKGGFARYFEDGDSLRVAEGLSFCWNAGFWYIICESDCIGAVKAVQVPTLDRDNIHKHSDIIGAVKDLVARDWSVKIVNIPREINSVAHALASWGAKNSPINVTWRSPPDFVLQVVGEDTYSPM
uniref:RNase H type-1 domain-containing protein n=1 Tax=Cajanus cajan TaxID=3821 RepID=A0A151RVL4_CAJCA|nr:hypothetical protein KK1_031806 [Cajanus cajan]